MARVLADTGAGITADWDNPDAMRAFIDHAWEQYQAGNAPETPGQAGGDEEQQNRGQAEAAVMPGPDRASGDIARFSRRNLTRELAALLEQVSHENK